MVNLIWDITMQYQLSQIKSHTHTVLTHPLSLSLSLSLSHSCTYFLWDLNILKGDSARVGSSLSHVPLLPSDTDSRAVPLDDEPSEGLSSWYPRLCRSGQQKVPKGESSREAWSHHDNVADDHYHTVKLCFIADDHFHTL